MPLKSDKAIRNFKDDSIIKYYHEIDNKFIDGIKLLQQNEINSAKNIFNQILYINPRHFASLHILGIIAANNNEHLLALELIGKALFINKNDVQALCNYGDSLQVLNRLGEAISTYSMAIETNPNYAEAYYKKGVVLNKICKYHDAIANFDKVIELKPDYAKAYNDRGIALLGLKIFNEALNCFIKALQLKADFTDAHNNLGVTMLELHNLDKALISFKKVIELQPDHLEARINLGNLLLDMGFLEDACTNYDEAINIKPDKAEAYFGKSLTLLLFGEFKKGFELYDWRWETNKFIGQKPVFSKPVWKGEIIKERLFIWGEQGLGDQILYSSIFNELFGYMPNVIVGIDKRLITLYQRSFPNIKFVDNKEVLSENDFGYQIAIGSTAQYFRSIYNDFEKSTFPYLYSDKSKNIEISAKLKRPGKIICGISWRSVNQDIGEYKSIPLNEFEPLLRLENIRFINLQYKSDYIKDCAITKYRKNIHDVNDVDIYTDIDSLSSIIQACDIVITCSNTTAHLAGALNKTTLLLLPAAVGRLWYWSENNGKSIWYPSIRVFRQKISGDWSKPINEIEQYLMNIDDGSNHEMQK